MNKLLKLKEAAELLSVSPQTLRDWDNQGKLKAIIINARGDRRYDKRDIELFMKRGIK